MSPWSSRRYEVRDSAAPFVGTQGPVVKVADPPPPVVPGETLRDLLDREGVRVGGVGHAHEFGPLLADRVLERVVADAVFDEEFVDQLAAAVPVAHPPEQVAERDLEERDVAQVGHHRDAERDALLRHRQQQVEAQAFDARHRRNLLALAFAFDDEDRKDQVVRRQHGFTHQAAAEIVAGATER